MSNVLYVNNLEKQIAENEKRYDKFDRMHKEASRQLVEERDELRQQLARAVAACKQKDVALEGLIDTMDLRLDDDDLSLETRTAFEALAIQPDDSALRTWLGEPIAYADPLDIAKDGNWDTFIVKHASEWNDTLRFKVPLYSPKGMK